MTQTRKRPTLAFALLAIITTLLSIFSAVLMTEPGQSLNLPREWIVTYFTNRWLLIGINLSLLAALWVFNEKYHFWRRHWLSIASVGVLVCIIAANFLLAAFFPSQQQGANYLPVAQADQLLTDEDVVYAVTINGDVKGYPRKHLEIPHIAGAEIGGEKIAMTFCALSNLPVVYDQDIGHGESDLGILIQTHNNLVLVDRNSGDLIQQITGKKEFSQSPIKTYPNDMMSWRSFKQLHPDAEVFIYSFDRALDSLLLAIFDKPMKQQFSPDHGPIFPTLSLADQRINNKEQIWGVNIAGEQAAFTERFLRSNPVFAFEIAGQNLVIKYNIEHRIATLYDRYVNSKTVAIDETLSTEHLTKLPLYNGVFWMVWSHWFPNTTLYNS